jgi:hypothetical protein
MWILKNVDLYAEEKQELWEGLKKNNNMFVVWLLPILGVECQRCRQSARLVQEMGIRRRVIDSHVFSAKPKGNTLQSTHKLECDLIPFYRRLQLCQFYHH